MDERTVPPVVLIVPREQRRGAVTWKLFGFAAAGCCFMAIVSSILTAWSGLPYLAAFAVLVVPWTVADRTATSRVELSLAHPGCLRIDQVSPWRTRATAGRVLAIEESSWGGMYRTTVALDSTRQRVSDRHSTGKPCVRRIRLDGLRSETVQQALTSLRT